MIKSLEPGTSDPVKESSSVGDFGSVSVRELASLLLSNTSDTTGCFDEPTE